MGKISKVKDLFPGYLEYMALKNQDPKTIREHKRFLDGPITDAVGDRAIGSLRLIDGAKVESAGRGYGEYGPQRAIVTFRRLLRYAKVSGFATPFDYRDLEVPKVKRKMNEAFLPEELDEIRDALNVADLAGLRTRALIEVLLDTGMYSRYPGKRSFTFDIFSIPQPSRVISSLSSARPSPPLGPSTIPENAPKGRSFPSKPPFAPSFPSRPKMA